MANPWENEPDSVDFEADGLPCAMRRNQYGVWCGYVGVGSGHPLFGLPINHSLKLPAAWFAGRVFDQGTGPMDLLLHALSGATIDEGCPISLAFHIHGGVTHAGDGVPGQAPDERWWFGFDCGHAHDRQPDLGAMVASMPEAARDIMQKVVFGDTIYRDRQYVVGELQSLAAQLNAVAVFLPAPPQQRRQ